MTHMSSENHFSYKVYFKNVTSALCDSVFLSPLWPLLLRRRWTTLQFPFSWAEMTDCRALVCHPLPLMRGKTCEANCVFDMYTYCICTSMCVLLKVAFRHLPGLSAEECFAASWPHKVTVAHCRPLRTPHCQSQPQRPFTTSQDMKRIN